MIYADDTILYFNMENVELKMVNDWLLHNKLSLNTDKTKCMIFHKQKKKIKLITYLSQLIGYQLKTLHSLDF